MAFLFEGKGVRVQVLLETNAAILAFMASCHLGSLTAL